MSDHIAQCRLAERALSERIGRFNEADRFLYRFLSESLKFVEGHAVAQMASVGDSHKSSADQVARRAS